MITLPSGIEIELLPFTGEIERLVQDKRLIQSGAFIDRYMSACIASIDGDDTMTPQQKEKAVLDMRSGDRNYLLVQIRINAYGADMIFNYECPKCNRTAGYQINLEDMLNTGELKVSPYKETPLRVDLPSGGYVDMDYLNGHDERRLARIKENRLSAATISFLKSINGSEPTLKGYEKLTGRDLMTIRGAISDMGGGLVPVIELECLECGSVNGAELAGIPDFFMPSMMSMGIAGV